MLRLHRALFGDRIGEAMDEALAAGFDPAEAQGDLRRLGECGRRPGEIALTTLQECQACAAGKFPEWNPRLYWSPKKYDAAWWRSRMERPGLILGAGRGALLPVGLLLRAQEDWLEGLCGKRQIFVKPDSGGKPFAGDCYDLDDPGWRNRLRQNARLAQPESLAWAGPALRLGPQEWRFAMLGRKPACAAPYGWDGELPGAPAPAGALRAALETGLAMSELPDGLWVADFGLDLDDGSWKLVETNAFSTSGVYGMDLKAYFKALGAAWDWEASDDFEGWDAPSAPQGDLDAALEYAACAGPAARPGRF